MVQRLSKTQLYEKWLLAHPDKAFGPGAVAVAAAALKLDPKGTSFFHARKRLIENGLLGLKSNGQKVNEDNDKIKKLLEDINTIRSLGIERTEAILQLIK